MKFSMEMHRLAESGETHIILRKLQNDAYRDREEPHSSPLTHHRTYGSVYGGSADPR